MNPATIIQQAKQDGVSITLSAEGIRATGTNEAIARWLPILRQQKSVLASALLESERQRIMDCMDEWVERWSLLMACASVSTEQARAMAWHDLGFDDVFFGIQRLH